MFLGYNTNGFAHHRLEDALHIIGKLGYSGAAITPDVTDFTTDRWEGDGRTLLKVLPRDEANHQLLCHRLAGTGFGEKCVVETGARFLLDPFAKHRPTLISPDEQDRTNRLRYLRWSVFFARSVGARAVSFWSGIPSDSASPGVLMDRLVEECKKLTDTAEGLDVRLAFEPEPGMFIDTMDKFAELHGRVDHPAFGLTIDVGHLVCNGELPVSKYLRDWKHVLWNVHIEDMRPGVHDHLMFGEGEVDFADVFAGLRDADYRGGVYVELSRHSYDAVNTARRAKAFLDGYLGEPRA